MKRLVITWVGFLCLGIPGLSSGEGAWKTFQGAYFSVQYPANFRARPSLRTEERYDSALFASPDGKVEFYVFSPIWNGEPKDIEIDSQREDYVAQEREDKGGVKIRRVTLKAKDGSYLRSFEDRENTQTNNRTVFGVKYRDQKAYDQYKPDYLAFKKSIVQFAD